ncbi:hypothetical protein WOLCODRAFT_160993 [Wolfiporia cocos MD-104 SS10]|uniref:Uncharacterized protein n=1 Tax=Wolfiporia cocos (strain MD-104) TaxID=742152 RepID=A0A2H3J716_WOLCO|nr:hypothetical protein WOLCODRAFT_160993 [Wolfiporia cocos MD-104 SS10]
MSFADDWAFSNKESLRPDHGLDTAFVHDALSYDPNFGPLPSASDLEDAFQLQSSLSQDLSHDYSPISDSSYERQDSGSGLLPFSPDTSDGFSSSLSCASHASSLVSCDDASQPTYSASVSPKAGDSLQSSPIDSLLLQLLVGDNESDWFDRLASPSPDTSNDAQPTSHAPPERCNVNVPLQSPQTVQEISADGRATLSPLRDADWLGLQSETVPNHMEMSFTAPPPNVHDGWPQDLTRRPSNASNFDVNVGPSGLSYGNVYNSIPTSFNASRSSTQEYTTLRATQTTVPAIPVGLPGYEQLRFGTAGVQDYRLNYRMLVPFALPILMVPTSMFVLPALNSGSLQLVLPPTLRDLSSVTNGNGKRETATSEPSGTHHAPVLEGVARESGEQTTKAMIAATLTPPRQEARSTGEVH